MPSSKSTYSKSESTTCLIFLSLSLSLRSHLPPWRRDLNVAMAGPCAALLASRIVAAAMLSMWSSLTSTKSAPTLNAFLDESETPEMSFSTREATICVIHFSRIVSFT